MTDPSTTAVNPPRFALGDGQAAFVPITLGIAGDQFFEVTAGLQPGDQVVTGPYNSVRGLAHGDAIRPAAPESR